MLKAKKEDPVPFTAKHCRRNWKGPLLVLQTMVKLKHLEAVNFSGMLSFDVDGKCMVQFPKHQKILWDDVAKNAHPYFCAVCFSGELVQKLLKYFHCS